jgi:LmbE family N-acetylglucosaminyl deacetylase
MKFRKCLILSPHFYDAVMSCGFWMERHQGSVVATVCSGSPGSGVRSIPWDRTSGFTYGADAAITRRAEDAAALLDLGAHQELLGFIDGEYRDGLGRCHEDISVIEPFEYALTAAIASTISELQPDLCIAPIGLAHGDHIITGRAARTALAEQTGCRLIVYADLPYVITNPQLVPDMVRQLQSCGLRISPFPTQLTGGIETKSQAVDRYESQAEQLTRDHPHWRECLRPDAEDFYSIRF